MANKFLSGINVTGTTTLNTVANAGTDTDKFLVLDASGNVDFRTGDELYADLGIASLGAGFTSTVKHSVKAGVALIKGQAVYVTSANGTNMIVGKASNASEATSSKTMGLIETSLSINGIGNVITEGLLAGLDTTGATNEGDPVWLGVDGVLLYGLANKPVAPAHLVFIGIVTRINANNGEIFVKVQNGFEMNEIHNYLEGSVQNNEVIVYESATSLYKPKTISTILGYTPVTNARTLTINGVAYDLSADREWTIEAGGSSASTRTIQKFTSTSSQTTFTITGGYTVGMVDVWVNGVKLDNAVDFTASNGTTVVLTDSLTASQIVEVYKYGSQFIVNNGLRQKTLFTATAGQTTFTVAYSVGLVDVYYNGSKLDDSEFTATNGTSIVLGTACAVNDKVEVIAFSYNVNGFTGIGGSGTINNIPKFTAAGTIGNSAITDDGTTVTLVSRALSGTSATLSSSLGVNSTIRSTGQTDPASGVGMELFYRAADTSSYIQSYDRTNGAWKDVRIYGNALYFGSQGTNNLTIASTGAATFSSSVTANTFVELIGDLRFNSTSADRSIYFRGSAGSPDTNWKMGNYLTPTGATVVTAAATVIDVFNGAGYGFMVRNTSNAPLLQIAGNTGAATFSSSVGINGVSAGANGEKLKVAGAVYIDAAESNTIFTSGAFLITPGTYNNFRQTTSHDLVIDTYNGGNILTPFTLKQNGNLGIGTSSPSERLHLYQNASAVELRMENNTISSYIRSQSDNFNFYVNGGERLRITSGGNVLIGTTTDSSGVRLKVAGGIIGCLDVYNNTTGVGANVNIDANGFFARSTSSLKYKKNINNLTKGLNEVLQLRPVTYNSINETETQTYAGLIAEEVHELGLTEFVQYAEDNTPDALSYGNMVSLLVKAIQELTEKVNELESKIK